MRMLLVLLAIIVIICAVYRFGVFVALWRYARGRAEWQPELQHHLYSAILMMAVAMLALLLAPAVSATSVLTAPAPASASARVHVPDASALYRHYVTQAASEVWGIDAPVARLAAQLHQESAWDPHARSGAGAEGLAQFMPSTGRWLAKAFPQLGPYDPWDPRWSAHAAAVYDQYLVARNGGDTACATWAFALSAYNGGERALHHEQQRAARAGLDRARWFGNVARYRARSGEAWAQNRRYVRRILTVLEPAYVDAGWPGKAVCHA